MLYCYKYNDKSQSGLPTLLPSYVAESTISSCLSQENNFMYNNISPRILTALVTLCFCASQASAYEVVAVSNGGKATATDLSF